jgi:outer membrane protein OmpA-like peptidoglycan-associated protein/tetratricopeptide (TPR) repeat protein
MKVNLFLSVILLNLVFVCKVNSQDTAVCPEVNNPRADKIYNKAITAFKHRNYTEAIKELKTVTEIEPGYTDAYFVLGLIYIQDRKMNLKEAKANFLQVIELCPDYDIYAYYHLARIYYGAGEYEKAYEAVSFFLDDVDKIKSDEDYNEAVGIQEFSKFYSEILSHPVPFDPKPVSGISTSMDEYLPIISPDNEFALFTRRVKTASSRDDFVRRTTTKEKFMYSIRIDGEFDRGREMPFPFNMNDNEGGATLTIDNKRLFYTLCKFTKDKKYYNCDICTSEFKDHKWTEIVSVSDNVNREDSWESQPSITSDGKVLYFVSDREGGYGGYDIYKTVKVDSCNWCPPENLGPEINTAGNEKSPFIHTDSQTLYFSSDGLMGLGGYDIFFTKLKPDGEWVKPKNIGYPINSEDDEVGFFASTDGKTGYFASNKYNGFGGWDLYSFELYQEARPEKVLFLKGKVESDSAGNLRDALIEVKNVETKKITEIKVDSTSGEYVSALLFKSDFIMTVKKKGYVQESKYISKMSPRFSNPVVLDLNLEPIIVGKSYRLNDIYFDFNSFELNPESKIVIDEFDDFLNGNPTLIVSIQGHTDNIGNDEDNMLLSKNRAEAVYRYLIEKGIAPERLSYKGFGETKPIDTNDTETGRARNRRTEFVIVGK